MTDIPTSTKEFYVTLFSQWLLRENKLTLTEESEAKTLMLKGLEYQLEDTGVSGRPILVARVNGRLEVVAYPWAGELVASSHIRVCDWGNELAFPHGYSTDVRGALTVSLGREPTDAEVAEIGDAAMARAYVAREAIWETTLRAWS